MKVAEYNIKYGEEDLVVAANTIETKEITLDRQKDIEDVRVRLRYEGYEEWSTWGSSQYPVCSKKVIY